MRNKKKYLDKEKVVDIGELEAVKSPAKIMNVDEAKECVSKINAGLESVRNLILDLYERKGWQALGYKSWRECVTAEFPQKQRYLYYELKAAQTERNLLPDLHNCAKDEIPESHLRPLSKLEDPEQQKEAWEKAVETAPEGRVTGRIVEEIVLKMTDSKRPKDTKPTKPTILDQLKQLWALATEEERIAFRCYIDPPGPDDSIDKDIPTEEPVGSSGRVEYKPAVGRRKKRLEPLLPKTEIGRKRQQTILNWYP